MEHLFFFSMVDIDQHTGMVSFVKAVSNLTLIEANLNFSELWPPYSEVGRRGHYEHFLIIDIDQHTGMVSLDVEGSLKSDLTTVTPNDPKMTSDQKFLNTPGTKEVFTQVSSKSDYRIM